MTVARIELARRQMQEAAAELRGAGPLRLALGGLGILVIGFGAVRILYDHTHTHPFGLAKWLAGAVIVHDFVIAPVSLAIGWLVARAVPGRAQAYVQGALAVAGVTTFVALPLIYRHGKSAPGTTLLRRAYGLNLLILFAVIALGAVAAYVIASRRAGSAAPGSDPPGSDPPGSARPSSRKQRPWIDQ